MTTATARSGSTTTGTRTAPQPPVDGRAGHGACAIRARVTIRDARAAPVRRRCDAGLTAHQPAPFRRAPPSTRPRTACKAAEGGAIARRQEYETNASECTDQALRPEGIVVRRFPAHARVRAGQLQPMRGSNARGLIAVACCALPPGLQAIWSPIGATSNLERPTASTSEVRFQARALLAASARRRRWPEAHSTEVRAQPIVTAATDDPRPTIAPMVTRLPRRSLCSWRALGLAQPPCS